MTYATPLYGAVGITLSIANGENTFTVDGVLLNAGDAIIALDEIAAGGAIARIKSINEDGDGGEIWGEWQGSTLVDDEDWIIIRSSPQRLSALQAAIVAREANDNLKLWGDRAPPYIVIDISNDPPVDPLEGDRYVVSTSPTGAWTGQENKIATFIGGTWRFTTPRIDETANVDALEKVYFFTSGSGWIALGEIGPGYAATSTTSTSIGTGSKSFTIQPGLAYSPGVRVRVTNTADLAKWMEGVCTAYSGTTLTILVDKVSGSGTLASWNVNVAGEPGATGATGATGSTGSTGAPGANCSGTSTTSLLIETGVSKVFATQAGKAWSVGQRLRAVSAADSSKWMTGKVTDYTGTALTILPDRIGTAATVSDWNINIDGEPGVTGSTGSTGSTGATGPGYAATSTSSLAIGTGSKSFTTQAGLAYTVGARVRASSAGDTAKWMEGVVSSYSGTALVVTVDKTNGSGTLADWNINLAGEPGLSGTGTGDVIAANNGTDFAAPWQVLENITKRDTTNITAAASLDLNSVQGSLVECDGNTNISTVTLSDGKCKRVLFNGTPTIIVGASLIGNGGGSNIAIEAGDIAFFEGHGSGIIRFFVIRKSGKPVVNTDISTLIRTKLTGNRTYNVRTAPVDVSISIASPGVVTQNGHGLLANDPVVLTILPYRAAVTVSVASPGVVTWNAHGFAAGQPFKFATTGRLPVGVTAGTTYYVLATGLTTNTFQFAATPGGAAINTTAPTVTVTIASPGVFTLNSHGLSVGDVVAFATTGALPTGLTANTLYFVKTVPNANTFTVSATPEGSVINTTGSQSGTHTLVQIGSHFGEKTGTMPTGLAQGTVYYVVGSTLTTNTYQLSATPGGAAINTSGSTEGTISASTGNDNNDGLSQTRAGAKLTIQSAVDAAVAIDAGIYSVAIQVADSMQTAAVNIKPLLNNGQLTIQGNTTYPSNCLINTTSADAFTFANKCNAYLNGFRIRTTTYGSGVIVQSDAIVALGALDFGACATAQIAILGLSQLSFAANYTISGGATWHLSVSGGGRHSAYGITVTLTGQPIFANQYINVSGMSFVQHGASTFLGPAKGQRYYVSEAAVLQTGGGGQNYFPGDTAGSTTTSGVYLP